MSYFKTYVALRPIVAVPPAKSQSNCVLTSIPSVFTFGPLKTLMSRRAMLVVLQSASLMTPSGVAPLAPPSRNANRPASGFARPPMHVAPVPNTKLVMPATGSLTSWSSKSNDQ